MAGTTDLLEKDMKLDKDPRTVGLSSWSNLLPELLNLIGLKMNVVDRFIFHHLVCKSWESSIAGSQVQSKVITCDIHTLPPRKPPHGVPYLMTLIDSVCTFYHPLMDTFCYKMSIPTLLSGAQIVFSKDGLLLLNKNNFSLFLFNPLKNVAQEVPKLPFLPTDAIAFSSYPNSPNFYIVAVNQYGRSFATIRNGESWNIHTFKKKFRLSYCTPVIINDKCYCLGVGGNIGVFDPLCEEESSTWEVFPHPFENMEGDIIYEKVEISRIYQSFLVEKNSELIRVIVLRDERHVLVSKWNHSDKTWSSVETLGDQMLYVSNAGTIAQKGELGRMGNSIYFPKMRNNCIFYSLASEMYLSFFIPFPKNVASTHMS